MEEAFYHLKGGKVATSASAAYRHIVCGGSKVLAGRSVVQPCHCSAFLSDWKFLSPPEWQGPLPR